MTFLTNKQQEMLKEEAKLLMNIKDFTDIKDIKVENTPLKEINTEDFEERIERALKTFYGFYQPTCRTEEDMRRCDNTSK